MGFFRWPRCKRRASVSKPIDPPPHISNPFEASRTPFDSQDDILRLPIPGAFPSTPPESPTLKPYLAPTEDEHIPPKGWEFMEVDVRTTPALIPDLGQHLHPRIPPYISPIPTPQRIPSPIPPKPAKPAKDDFMDVDDPWAHQAQEDARRLHGPVSAVQLFHANRRPIPAHREASLYQSAFEQLEEKRIARELELQRPTRVRPVGEPVRQLSAEWLAKVQRAMQSGQGHAVARSLTGDDLCQKDIVTCIRPLAWLNDEIINAYLGVLVHYLRQSNGNLKPNVQPRFHAFNTFFYSTLRDKQYPAVQRWAKRAKIGGEGLLNVDTVFIPVHEINHWTLMVVRPEDRTIEYFDSMGSRGGFQVAKIKEWLRGELGSKYKDEEWTVLPSVSSHQDNGSDCGVFLLTNAKAIAVGVEPTAIRPRHIKLLRRKIVAELMNGGLHGDFSPLDKATGALLL